MRYPASEKLEIIRLVEQSHLPVRRTLEKLGIPRATFYRWYDLYQSGGPEALEDRPSKPNRVWNRIPEATRRQIIALALEEPELSPRELAVRFTDERKYFVSEASVYRLLKGHDLITSSAFIVIKAADEFRDKTTAPNQLWQTDFTYLKVTGWGWYYLSTVLDDFSRYIVAWKLCATMQASDVTETLERALAASGLNQVSVVHRPRLLSDNGSSYVSGDLARWLDGQKMAHIRGAPRHPQTQGKIERWHQTLKNRILLEHYYLPGALEAQVGAFVEHYNHQRYHESLDNLAPADVYFGRGSTILIERERIKRETIPTTALAAPGPRRLTPNPDGPDPPLAQTPSCPECLTTDRHWRPDNPAKGIKRYDEEKRDRWLSDEELRRLCRVLDEHPNQRASNAVRLQLLTGARLGEVLKADRADFDLERGVWTKPSHHTKQKRREHVPLSAEAQALVAAILSEQDAGSPYLFPGDAPGKPLQDIKKFWASVLRKTGIRSYRLHDNRHTYASHLVSSGLSLEIVGRLLGHTQASTTKRYAHLADDPLRAATERFGAKVANHRS